MRYTGVREGVEVVVIIKSMGLLSIVLPFVFPASPPKSNISENPSTIHITQKLMWIKTPKKSSLPDDQARGNAGNDKLTGAHVALRASLVPGKVSSGKGAGRVHLLHTSRPVGRPGEGESTLR